MLDFLEGAKMIRALENLFTKSTKSAKVAKNRLQLVIARDRVGIPEGKMAELKDDLYQVISKYFDLDPSSLEIEIFNKDGQPALTVNTTMNSPHR